MTGLDRLRELADGMGYRTVWSSTDDGYRERHRLSVGNDGSSLGAMLYAIADQIEAEQEERITRRVEDREAAEWVREHGGLDAVEDVVKTNEWALSLAVIAHDALFGEDGERDTTPTEFKNELEKRLIPEGMDWLLEVWPKWSNGEYCKFGDWWTADKYGDYEPKQLRRLVFYTPEQLREWEQDEGDNFGYEWDFMRPSDTTYRPDKAAPPAPKVLDADGVEIRVGDTVYGFAGQQYEVTGLCEYEPSIVHAKTVGDGVAADELLALSGQLNSAQLEASKLTHQRPVLDADGVPIKVGDTVYFTDGREQKCNTVVHAKYDYKDEPYVQLGRLNEIGYPTYTNGSCVDPLQLTHRAPVIAADGEPLEAGQTAYLNRDSGSMKKGTRLLVVSVSSRAVEATIGTDVGAQTHPFRPADLTHTKPESPKRCRDCAHWQKDPTADKMGVCWFFYHEYEGQDCYSARLGDIGACEEFMPRASALAERERGE